MSADNQLSEKELNYPKIDITDLLSKIENRFLLSVAISKRARQLAEGEKPLVDIVRDKPFSPIAVAMKELYHDKFEVGIKEDSDDEIELLEKLDKGLDEKLEKEANAASAKDKKPKSKSMLTL